MKRSGALLTWLFVILGLQIIGSQGADTPLPTLSAIVKGCTIVAVNAMSVVKPVSENIENIEAALDREIESNQHCLRHHFSWFILGLL